MTNFIIILAIVAFVFCFAYGFDKSLNYLKSKQMINNFADYRAVLQLHLDRAYEMIHKDRILVYSLEASRLPEEELNTISKDFINLVVKLIGPRLHDEFIFLYGNYETFVFNLAEYFSTRYEEDEIRKSSVNEMMESESLSES